MIRWARDWQGPRFAIGAPRFPFASPRELLRFCNRPMMVNRIRGGLSRRRLLVVKGTKAAKQHQRLRSAIRHFVPVRCENEGLSASKSARLSIARISTAVNYSTGPLAGSSGNSCWTSEHAPEYAQRSKPGTPCPGPRRRAPDSVLLTFYKGRMNSRAAYCLIHFIT